MPKSRHAIRRLMLDWACLFDAGKRQAAELAQKGELVGSGGRHFDGGSDGMDVTHHRLLEWKISSNSKASPSKPNDRPTQNSNCEPRRRICTIMPMEQIIEVRHYRGPWFNFFEQSCPCLEYVHSSYNLQRFERLFGASCHWLGKQPKETCHARERGLDMSNTAIVTCAYYLQAQ